MLNKLQKEALQELHWTFWLLPDLQAKIDAADTKYVKLTTTTTFTITITAFTTTTATSTTIPTLVHSHSLCSWLRK